jgi:hypothetical protein
MCRLLTQSVCYRQTHSSGTAAMKSQLLLGTAARHNTHTRLWKVYSAPPPSHKDRHTDGRTTDTHTHTHTHTHTPNAPASLRWLLLLLLLHCSCGLVVIHACPRGGKRQARHRDMPCRRCNQFGCACCKRWRAVSVRPHTGKLDRRTRATRTHTHTRDVHAMHEPHTRMHMPCTCPGAQRTGAADMCSGRAAAHSTPQRTSCHAGPGGPRAAAQNAGGAAQVCVCGVRAPCSWLAHAPRHTPTRQRATTQTSLASVGCTMPGEACRAASRAQKQTRCTHQRGDRATHMPPPRPRPHRATALAAAARAAPAAQHGAPSPRPPPTPTLLGQRSRRARTPPPPAAPRREAAGC